MCIVTLDAQIAPSLDKIPVSSLYKSIAGRYRPVRVADGPITARYGFLKNASWDVVSGKYVSYFPTVT